MILLSSLPPWTEGLLFFLPFLALGLGCALLKQEDADDPDAEDKRLVARAQRGDRNAFNSIIRKYQGRVYAFSYRMIPDVEEAEEVTQDVFVNLHKHLGRFRGDSKFSTWLYQIAKNISLNKIKSLKRRRKLAHQSIDAPRGNDETEGRRYLEIVDERKNAHEQAEGRELRTLVSRKIQELREEHRLPLILRDIEGLRYDEIAKVMKLAEGTVKSRIHRARVELKESLNGHL